MWLEGGPITTRELTLDEVSTIIDKISNAPGASGITITGGEPLLRSDLTEIVGICSRAGLKVALATNGVLLTKQLALGLVSSGIEHFDIGFTEPSDKVKLAVAAAAATGCSVTASVCVHNGNYRETGTLTKKAAVMGADAVALNRFVPTGRGRTNQKDLRLKKQDLVTALELANQAAADSGIFVYAGIPVEPCTARWEQFPEITFSTCQCGEMKWAIDPVGNLKTCEQNPETLGNLLKSSFNEIVEDSKNSIDSFRQWRNYGGCFSCSLPGECSGGCRFAADSSLPLHTPGAPEPSAPAV